MARQTVWVEPPLLQASTAARVQVELTLEARLEQEVEPRAEVVKRRSECATRALGPTSVAARTPVRQSTANRWRAPQVTRRDQTARLQGAERSHKQIACTIAVASDPDGSSLCDPLEHSCGAL